MNLVIEVLITIVFITFFMFLISKLKWFTNSAIKTKWYQILLIIKVLVGISSFAIHKTYISGNDDIMLFEDSKIIYQELFNDSENFIRIFFNKKNDTEKTKELRNKLNKWNIPHNYGMAKDNRTLIRFHVIGNIFSFGHYFPNLVLICFFSLFGLRALEKLMLKITPNKPQEAFIFIHLLPSTLFWSSSMQKEALAICFLGLFIYYAYTLYQNIGVTKYWFLFLLSFVLLTQIKTYFILMLVAPLIFLFFKRANSNKKEWVSFLGIETLIIITIFTFDSLSSGISFFSLWQQKQEAFINLAEFTNAGSSFNIPALYHHYQILTLAPQALLNVFIQYQLFPFNKAIYLLPVLENLIILLFFFTTYKYQAKMNRKQIVLLIFCIGFILNTGVLIGETVPIHGAISRYKAPLTPFIGIILIILTDFNKFYKKFPRLKPNLIK